MIACLYDYIWFLDRTFTSEIYTQHYHTSLQFNHHFHEHDRVLTVCIIPTYTNSKYLWCWFGWKFESFTYKLVLSGCLIFFKLRSHQRLHKGINYGANSHQSSCKRRKLLVVQKNLVWNFVFFSNLTIRLGIWIFIWLLYNSRSCEILMQFRFWLKGVLYFFAELHPPSFV